MSAQALHNQDYAAKQAQSGGLSTPAPDAYAGVDAAVPSAPSTWGSNGLDTVTGYANGVVSNGSGGYTYNGIDVNSDGSRVQQGPIDTSNPNPGAWTPSPVAPAQPSPSYPLNYGQNNPPPDYTAYSLDFPKYSPIQQTPDYANRIGPGYLPAARPTAPTVPDPRIAQSFSGVTNPDNASYPSPGIPTAQLGHGDNAWDFTKQAVGDVAGVAGKALTPITKTYGYAGEGGKALAGMAGSAVTGDIVGPTAGRNAYNSATEDWHPLAKALADTAVNPANYLGPAAGKLLVKGSGILPTIGRNLVDQGGIKMALGATAGSYGGQKLAEKAGAGEGVQQAAALAGGLTGGIGALAIKPKAILRAPGSLRPLAAGIEDVPPPQLGQTFQTLYHGSESANVHSLTDLTLSYGGRYDAHGIWLTDVPERANSYNRMGKGTVLSGPVDTSAFLDLTDPTARSQFVSAHPEIFQHEPRLASAEDMLTYGYGPQDIAEFNRILDAASTDGHVGVKVLDNLGDPGKPKNGHTSYVVLDKSVLGADTPVNAGLDKPPSFGNYPSEEAYSQAQLGRIAHGKPGLSVETGEAPGLTQIVFRDEAGKPLGAIQFAGDSVSDLAVSPEARRLGIGTMLREEAAKMGATESVGPVSDAARGMGSPPKPPGEPPRPRPEPPTPEPPTNKDLLKGVAREYGRVVGHSAVGSAMGAATGAYAGEGDPNAILKGALIGAGAGAGFRVMAKAADALGSKGVAAKQAARNKALGVPEPPAAVSKLTEIIKAAKPVRAETEILKSAALSKKAAQLHGVYGANSGEAAFKRAPGALGGELPSASFDAPRPSFAQSEVDDLFSHIVNNPVVTGANKEKIFNVFNTQGALTKALAGELPTNGEIALLEKAFGPELAKALLGQRSFGAKAVATALDAINMPRTLITAFDASAPLRQGAILAAGHPLTSLKSTGTMIRAMASDSFAKAAADGIDLSPNAGIYDKMKLYFADTSAGGALAVREEAFMSRMAEKIPGIAGSQRGYTTYLNKVRQDVADNWIKSLSPAELKDTKTLEQMGNWLNIASGRGKLPAAADRIVTVSGGLFFAPRYAISRLQVPVEMFKAANPMSGMAATVRKEVARDMVSFIGTGVSILALGKLGGYWEAETDPRSTDFGKIRIGATRFDMWAGEQQPIRTIAQFMNGQRKSTSTGQLIPTDRSDTLLRFLRSKASPATGLAWDIGEGKTFIGEDISADKSTLYGQSFQHLAPLFLQDVTEAWMEDGWKAAAKTLPAGGGLGVQTYLSTRDIQNTVSQDMFGKVFLDLTKGERDIVNADPKVAAENAKYNANVEANPSQFFDRKDEVYQQLETDLRTKVDAGMQGVDLRHAVSDLKGDRWTASQALLGGDAVQKAIANGTPKTQIIDALADAYWSAPVTEDPATGNLDFEGRDAARATVLAKVKEAGLDPNYITGSGLGTFRGERFSDPVVAEAVAKVEDAQKQIEDSGYWNLQDKAWEAFKQQHSAQLGQLPEYWTWRDNEIKQVSADLAAKGTDPKLIPSMAATEVAGYKTISLFSEFYRTEFRHQWVVDNPELAKTAVQWEYFTGDAAEKKFLGMKK